MTKTKKYVRILKAGEPSYWYINKIGRMFEFEREGDFTYKTREKDGSLAVIRKEDAELIVTEKRPAKRHDRILITNAAMHGLYKNGDEFVVDMEYTFGNGVSVYAEYDIHRLWGYYVTYSEYEVIVNNEVKNGEADEVERYDTAVETARDAIEELRLAAYAKGFEDARRELTATAPVEKTAQERRDEIVEQAKADVSDLNNRDIGHDHEFIVNTEKRTVVVLRKLRGCTNIVRRGIAKAAPDDCFNEHIGKAIALHRALGLEVPDEYLNTPQPTEVRVGDVVRSIVDRSKEYVISEDEKARCGSGAGLTSLVAKYGKIIDDSRKEVGEWL